MNDLGASANNLDAIAFLRSPEPEPLPEPASMLLLGLGLVSGFFWTRRRQLHRCYIRLSSKRPRG
ncbi:MAG: PEP-CTERM sorting domain-containing protein [Candidatus Binatia bacterium]